MVLTNFSLVEPLPTVVLASEGLEWDLHGFADFLGFEYKTPDALLVLRWSVPADAKNPWGCAANTYSGCELRFSGVSTLRVSPRGSGTSDEEDRCLADISWTDSEDSKLLFTLQSERTLEVVANNAELVPISRGSAS